ncbi:ATP-binding cassette domain-containing protein, partial [Clostridioides difficile]
SYMYQKDLLLPYKTIIDNVSLPLILKKEKKSKARSMVKPYFEVFGLSGYEDKYPSELSGGMRQRANFLRTFINSNDIMLLDEPFGALDSLTKTSMQKWLLDVKKKVNSTILLITHDIDEAIMLSNRIYVISKKPSIVKKEFVIDSRKLNEDNLENIIKLKKEIISLL